MDFPTFNNLYIVRSPYLKTDIPHCYYLILKEFAGTKPFADNYLVKERGTGLRQFADITCFNYDILLKSNQHRCNFMY